MYDKMLIDRVRLDKVIPIIVSSISESFSATFIQSNALQYSLELKVVGLHPTSLAQNFLID